MSHLIQLKRRIKSIKTTQKITQAMRLIAMSLYSKLDKQQKPMHHYADSIKDLFFALSQKNPDWKSPIFFPEDVLNTNPLIIVISSTKGFCGGLNNTLFRYLEYKLHIEEHQTPNFLTIGKKATSFVDDKKLGTILASYHDLNSNNFGDIAQTIAQLIATQTTPFSSVTIYSTVFKNFFIQKPIINQIIPLKVEKNDTKTEDLSENELIWEQQTTRVIDFVATQYLNGHLTNVLFQALVSEYAARFVAMDNASTNAENYLESLTLQFNKMRQSLITREVSELSASL